MERVNVVSILGYILGIYVGGGGLLIGISYWLIDEKIEGIIREI